MKGFLPVTVIGIGMLFLAGCSDSLKAETTLPEVAQAASSTSLEFPPLLDLRERFIDLDDFSNPWKWYSTPGGRLSFLYPQSWETDIAEWSVSRTIHLTSKEDSSVQTDILFTVYPVEEGSVEQAMNDAARRIREDAMTLRVMRGAADFLSPKDGPSAFSLYRTTVDTAGSSLHVFVPRAASFLEIEIIGADPQLTFPLRILLESVKFRD